jgi:serine/threonine protein phosphatase 1
MFIVGDVHGCLKTLKKLEKACQSWAREPMVFVGDLIDRGPFSAQTVNWVQDRGYQVSVGNHELVMVEWGEQGLYNLGDQNCGVESDYWFRNGGDRTVMSYTRVVEFENHVKWFKTLPWYLHFPQLTNRAGRELFVSHSAITHYSIKQCIDSRDLVWGRNAPLRTNNYFNVFGHTPLKIPDVTDYYAAIDTAGCYGNKLTALHYPSMKMFSVSCEDEVLLPGQVRPKFRVRPWG